MDEELGGPQSRFGHCGEENLNPAENRTAALLLSRPYRYTVVVDISQLPEQVTVGRCVLHKEEEKMDFFDQLSVSASEKLPAAYTYFESVMYMNFDI
jgi:hypothetical protein